jgi:hypothetical protein
MFGNPGVKLGRGMAAGESHRAVRREAMAVIEID